MKILIQFITVALFVLIADFVWLGVVMKGFYQQEIGGLMRQGPSGFSPRIIPAILVYVLIPSGIVAFVGPRVTPPTSVLSAAISGALFGLIVYGIYDLSNLAVLERWTMRVTLADIAWGMSLCAASTVCMTLIEIFFSQSTQRVSTPP
jgi:uncharacterized membrane protein